MKQIRNGKVIELTAEEIAEFPTVTVSKKEALRSAIRQIREKSSALIAAGAPHASTRWPADEKSQLAKSSMAASIGAGRGLAKGRATITARDINRTKHEMTQSEYLDLSEAIRDYVFSIMENADDHIDALTLLLADDTKTAQDITDYDITTGWPE